MMKKITVIADAENIDILLNFVNTELELCGFPEELIPDINVAVEEIFINISDYAYVPTNGNVTVFMSVDMSGGDKVATFVFEDSGMPFNPLEAPTPDLDKPPIERDIGGLGILFVKQLMDDVSYTYVEDKNILTIKKRG